MSDTQELRRRTFLEGLVVFAGSLPVLGAVIAAMRVMLSPAHRRGEAEAVVCKVSEVPKDGVLRRTVRYRKRTGPFLEEIERTVFLRLERRDDGGDRIVAMSGECTHLGCPVHFEEKDGKFKCPCHGGVFAPDGKVLDGPPPVPLSRFEVIEPGPDGTVRLRVGV